MSLVPDTTENNGRMDLGSALQFSATGAQINIPATIAANGSVTSQLIFSTGWKLLTFSLTSTQAGNLTLQRYIDLTGTIKQGSALSATLSANTQALINLSDNYPFQTFSITVTNTAGSTATLSNVILLMQSE